MTRPSYDKIQKNRGQWCVVLKAHHGGGLIDTHYSRTRAELWQHRYNRKSKCKCECAVVMSFSEYDKLPSWEEQIGINPNAPSKPKSEYKQRQEQVEIDLKPRKKVSLADLPPLFEQPVIPWVKVEEVEKAMEKDIRQAEIIKRDMKRKANENAMANPSSVSAVMFTKVKK